MKVRVMLGKLSVEEQEQNCPQFCLPKCRIGLEYEWEGTHRFYEDPQSNDPPVVSKVRNYYASHVDGSLRGAGREFNFISPYCGTRLYNAIEAMDELSRAFDFRSSYRTSLHVNMDCSELEIPEDINGLCMIYALSEPFLYKFVGQNREFCNYCLPWYAHPEHFQLYLKTLKKEGTSAQGLGGSMRNSKPTMKYWGFNLLSLGQFGAVEYRHAPVNMQMPKILTWINLLMRQKEYVMAHGNIKGEGLARSLKRLGPEKFFEEIYKSHTPEFFRFSRNIGLDAQLGLATLYSFLTYKV